MYDILLVYPPYLSKYKNPPLGLAYIGSYLESNGYSVKILDMDPLGIDFNDLEKLIKKNKPAIIGISFMTNQFGSAIKISQIVKKTDPAIKVVVGGNHASALSEELLGYDTVDIVVVGEGEYTMLELIEALDRENEDLSQIDGLAFRQNGSVFQTPRRQLIEDLDMLPFPLWRDFPIRKYSEMIIGVKEELPAFSVLATRGCPYRCAFCSSHIIFDRKIRFRSPRNILDELLFLYEHYRAKHFNFIDDTLTINHKLVLQLCNLIIEGGYDFKWIANARVNTVTLELLQKMRQAGCTNINFGIESGDPRVRKNINKNIAADEIKNAHKWAKQVGMIVSSYFMVGNKGEGWESVEMTIQLARELMTDCPTCSIATPFPGTPMYHEFGRNGWIRVKDWNKYYTTPHLIQDYVPICINDKMDQSEISNAYYYINAEFAKIKLKTKYGKFFFINPKLLKKEVLTRLNQQGLGGSLKLAYKVLKGLVRNVWNLRNL